MKRFLILTAITALCFSSCGIYTFSPSALGGIKTIAIAEFENNTTEYGIDILVTDQVNESFVQNNALKVVPESQADIVLKGIISSYSHDPYTYDQSEAVQEYICRITLKIKIEYTDSEKILWEDENLSDYGVYSIPDSQTQDEGNEIAIKKLADEILNRTVKDW